MVLLVGKTEDNYENSSVAPCTTSVLRVKEIFTVGHHFILVYYL